MTKNGGVSFAIRSGGTSANTGAADIDGRVTLNLRSLNNTRLNTQRTAATIGAGALWRDVYQELDVYRLSAVVARIATSGIGGFLTGGRISNSMNLVNIIW